MGVFQMVPNYVKYQITMNLRFLSENIISTGIYMFKVNNRNSRTRCEICSKLTIKTPERRQWNRTRQNRHLHCHRHYKKFIFGSRIFFWKNRLFMSNTPQYSSWAYLFLQTNLVFLKSGSHLPRKIILITSLESSLKMMKNSFYFILKALFVLKIFNFLSWLVGDIGKTAWLKR